MMPFGHGYPAQFTTAFFSHPGDIFKNPFLLQFMVYEGGVVISGERLKNIEGEYEYEPLTDADIDHPQFIEALKEAMHYQRERLPGREGSYDNQNQPMGGPSNPFTFTIKSPNYGAKDDDHSITITYLEGSWLRKSLMNRPIQYIPMEMHTRLVKAAEDEVRLNIQSIVEEQVRRGVEGGVSRAIQQGTATLKEIETKKRELEKELARLEKLEARVVEREAAKAAKQKDRTTEGYVYLVRSLTSPNYYKIGRTKNPSQRLRTFGVTLPFEIEAICLIQTDDMYALESELHQRYADKRVNGEFFALDEHDVTHIRQLAGGECPAQGE